MKLFSIVASLIVLLFPPLTWGQTHVSSCQKRDGVERARCERHEKMFEKCGGIKGAAHHQCDRDFLLANPLDCATLTDKAVTSCTAEISAFKACETNTGVAFMQCVKKQTGESPMGH